MKPGVRIGILIGGLVFGVVVALLAISAVFRSVPTTITRVGRILEATDDPAHSPRLVVLGNSVAMSGIDAQQLETELRVPGPSYNFSYQGQTLVESYLLQRRLSDSVELVVQLVQVASGRRIRALDPQKYNNLYMWGYRPSPETIARLRDVYGDPVAAILETSGLAQRFAARWSIQQFADFWLRQLSREPRDREFIQTNLTLPVPYGRSVADEILDQQIDTRAADLASSGYRLDARRTRMIEVLLEDSQRAGRRHVIVFAPLHPALRPEVSKQDLAALARFGESLETPENVYVVDTTLLLSKLDFHDDIHPRVSGARRITRMIARAVGGPR